MRSQLINFMQFSAVFFVYVYRIPSVLKNKLYIIFYNVYIIYICTYTYKYIVYCIILVYALQYNTTNNSIQLVYDTIIKTYTHVCIYIKCVVRSRINNLVIFFSVNACKKDSEEWKWDCRLK